MRRLLIAVTAALAVTLAAAGAATAADVVRFRIDIGFEEPFLRADITQACGFQVYVQGDGYLNVMLQYDSAGRLLRETYSTPGAFVTYTAPAMGTSYRFPWMPREQFTYPEGATIGGPAILRSTGMIVNHPGEPAEAGVVVLKGTVVGISPDGVPFVDFTDVQIADVFARGSLARADNPTKSICSALTAT